MEFKEVLEVLELVNSKKKVISKPPIEVGKNYFIRTVTHYYTGKVKEVTTQWVTLEDAAWIADTGRFHDFLKDGKCNEYEGFIDPVMIPIGGVIDVTAWNHPLFKGQK